jgi:serine/threonine protein kinase
MGTSGSIFEEESCGNSSAKVSKQVDARAGKIAFSGRYHKAPRNVEDDYTLSSEVLGNGMCGEVTIASSKRDPQQKVAIKKLSRRKAKSMAEVQTMLCLDHHHIVRLLDVYETEAHLVLVMECLEGGELFDRVKEEPFSEEEARDALLQMLQALNYLHSHGIVHRDVKLENFVYCKKGSRHLKLIDFGLSALAKPSEKFRSAVGTMGYAAPEVFDGSYTSKCDMWSLGVVAYILLSGTMPATEGRHTFRTAKWKKISPEAIKFVESLMKVNPAERLSAEGALAHPWIANSLAPVTPNISKSDLQSLHTYSKATGFERSCLKMMALLSSDEDQAKKNLGSFLLSGQESTRHT